MNRFIDLQTYLFPGTKKKKKEPELNVNSRGAIAKESNGTYNHGRSFDTPAFNFWEDANPMNDENERDDSIFSGAASTSAISAHCQLNAATGASTAHFNLDEFACHDKERSPVPEAVRGNTQILMEQLEVLRAELNAGVTVSSGYRTVPYNKSVGGESNSMHLCGMAADIKVPGYTPKQVKDIIEELIASGRMLQGGLGLYNSFVHYDIRGEKARWLGKKMTASQTYGNAFSAGYYDWPDRFGQGDSAYDAGAAKWIISNRSAVPIFPQLIVIFAKSNPGEKKPKKYRFKATTTDIAAKKAEDYKLRGYNYEGHASTDPLPNWNEPDAAKRKVFEEVGVEMRTHEGGISSVNTYDNQQVTLGWGLSLKFDGNSHDKGIKMLQYNLDASPDLKNAMLEVGLAIKDHKVLYFGPEASPSAILTGVRAMEGFKLDSKVLSRLITELEKRPKLNADNNARAFKEIRMTNLPEEFFTWPTDSIKLAISLAHWAPAGISWPALKTSKGDIAAIVKSFSLRFHAKHKGGYPDDYALSDNSNGSLYANDKRTVLIKRGNSVFTKEAMAGRIKFIDKSAYGKEYETDPKYKDYVFVELKEKVYLLP